MKNIQSKSSFRQLFLFLGFFNIIFCETAPAQHKVSNKFIDSLFEYHLGASKMAGVCGSIIINNKVVWMKGYGYADIEKKIPFTPFTILNAGSIAKTVTGVCMMRLVEEGKLSLDEDINKYLPFKVINPYFPNEKITLRMIATHSSSLADREPFYADSAYFTGADSPVVLGDFLRYYFSPDGKNYSDSNFYNSKPGTYWEYSNIAAALAGYIVELKSGKELNEYSRQIIFSPLKMKSTGWFLSEVDLEKHAKLYQNKGDSTINIPLYGFATYPDGGLRTSVAELSKFFVVLLNNGTYKKKHILKRKTLANMQQLQFAASKKPENIDLANKNEGIFWRTKYNVTRLGHGGNDRGVKTLMLTDLKKEAGVILFTNTEDDNNKRTNSFFIIFDELLKYALSLKSEDKK